MPRIELHEWAFMDFCTSQQHKHTRILYNEITYFVNERVLTHSFTVMIMKESYQIRYSGPTLICMELNFVEP